MTGSLYYGDNLTVLRESIATESVDLVYLDPPFNSNASYNVLFKAKTGQQSKAQIEAFEDTWHWSQEAEAAFMDVLRNPQYGDAGTMLQAMRSALHETDMMAYLAMMAARLIELHRVLKPTGSLYLHCDPTASHYLKVLLDAIFGAERFLNEIVWQRTGAHNDARRFGRVTDTILLYSKTANYIFSPQYEGYAPAYIEERYRYLNPDGRRFWANTATSPNPRPNMMYEWKGYPSPPNGWRFGTCHDGADGTREEALLLEIRHGLREELPRRAGKRGALRRTFGQTLSWESPGLSASAIPRRSRLPC